MANDNTPQGLQPVNSPYGSIKRTRYPISTDYATDLFIGDPVDSVAAGTIERATAGAGNMILGAIVGFWKDGEGPKNYFPASSSGTWYAEVADDVNQEFVMQEDGDTSDLAANSAGAGADVVAGSGDTTTGISGFQIDSDTVGTGATLQLRLIEKIKTVNNAYGDYCMWKVRINYHRHGVGTVGAPV